MALTWLELDLRSDPDVADYPGDPGDLAGAGPNLLTELLARPRWMADGLCLEHPEVSWFPVRAATSDPPRTSAGHVWWRPSA